MKFERQFIFIIALVRTVCGTVAPTTAPSISQNPTESPTLYPTQILQTRFNVFVNIRTTPQYEVSYFKRYYRTSIEAAVVEILQFPIQDVVLGQVLVSDVTLINDGKSLVEEDEITIFGDQCTLTSPLQVSVTLKVSSIVENTGYSNKTHAFSNIAAQLSGATENGRLQNLTNKYIPILNPSFNLKPLNISCFSATPDDITERILRSPVPSAAPTVLPDSDGPKKYAVAICMSVLLVFALFVMASGSVVDNRDKENRIRPDTEMSDNRLRFSDTYSGQNMDDMALVEPSSEKRKYLQEAISIVKSAVPYLEYVHHMDLVRAFVSKLKTTDPDFEGVADTGELDEVVVPWSYYLGCILGTHDERYAENIWLQHRWFSCIFYVPNRSRAMRCLCVFYFAVMILCFDCLLIVHTDILDTAKELDIYYIREVLILCCITALVSASFYGVIETLIFYSFDESREKLSPLAIDLSKPNISANGQGPANWIPPTTNEREYFDMSPDSAQIGTEEESRKRAKGRSMMSQLARPGSEQIRSPSPPKRNSPRVSSSKSGNRKKGRVEPLAQRKQNTLPLNISDQFHNILTAEERLSSEPLLEELLLLQDNILMCREAIHSACNQNRISSSFDETRSNSSDLEIAMEDAILAVQFDAMWGLDSDGYILTEGASISNWRDLSVDSDENKLYLWWRTFVSSYFTAYKGEVHRPKEAEGLNNVLINISSEVVRIRRQVLKEQLRLYSEIVAVDTISSTETGNIRYSEDFDLSSNFGFARDSSVVTSLKKISYLSRGDDTVKYRKRLIQLFHNDILPPVSAAVVRNQIHRARWFTEKLYADTAVKTFGMIFVLLSLITMMAWIYYYSVHILNKRQTSILTVFLFWLVLDMLVVEPLSVLLRHVVLPSVAIKDVSGVISWLVFNIVSKDDEMRRKAKSATRGEQDQTLKREISSNNLLVRPPIHGEIIPERPVENNESDHVKTMRLFNAAKYFFVSVRLANMTTIDRPFLEAVAVSEFHTLWPKRRFTTEFGARNLFGYFTNKGVCLFGDQPEESGDIERPISGKMEVSRVESLSQKGSSVVPVSHNVGAPSIFVNAPSVAQWVPQSAKSNIFHSSSLLEKYFDVSSFSELCELAVTITFFYYIEFLPILLQNLFLEYFLWAVICWFLYLCSYIAVTNAVLLILPAIGFLLFTRILLSLLLNKNTMGLPAGEFELDPIVDDNEYNDFEGDWEDKEDLNYNDNATQRRSFEYIDQYEQPEEGNLFIDQPGLFELNTDADPNETRRAYHDRSEGFYDEDKDLGAGDADRKLDEDSVFGNDSFVHRDHDSLAQKPQNESTRSRTVSGLPSQEAKRKRKVTHGNTVTLPPSVNDRITDDQNHPEGDKNLDDAAVYDTIEPNGKGYYENSLSETIRAERRAEQARLHRNHRQKYDHHKHVHDEHEMRNGNSAGNPHREHFVEPMAVAGGGTVFRSTTAYSRQDENKQRSIREGKNAYISNAKHTMDARAFEENDTPFTEVPTYGDSIHRVNIRDPGSSVTPAMLGRRADAAPDVKYKEIISPPNATPLLGRSGAVPLSDDSVKRSPIDMNELIQSEVKNNARPAFLLDESDIDSDAEVDSFDGVSEDSVSEMPPKSPEITEGQNKILFTMTRFGKSN